MPSLRTWFVASSGWSVVETVPSYGVSLSVKYLHSFTATLGLLNLFRYDMRVFVRAEMSINLRLKPLALSLECSDSGA